MMFLWEDYRYLPYIKINKLKIDNQDINLSEKNDWRSINQLIVNRYQSSLSKNWENLEMNISICIDDEEGSRETDKIKSAQINRNMNFLKEKGPQNVSLKIVSVSSKTYKSFELINFDSETDGLPILSWTSDISISSLHLSENLLLYPSITGKVESFGEKGLNLAGGDSFIKDEGFLINFDEPDDMFGGKDIKLIKLDFNSGVTQTGENYKEYIPKNNKWNKYIKSNIKQHNTELLKYLSQYWECSQNEVKEYLNFLEDDIIFSILNQMGVPQKEQNKLL